MFGQGSRACRPACRRVPLTRPRPHSKSCIPPSPPATGRGTAGPLSGLAWPIRPYWSGVKTASIPSICRDSPAHDVGRDVMTRHRIDTPRVMMSQDPRVGTLQDRGAGPYWIGELSVGHDQEPAALLPDGLCRGIVEALPISGIAASGTATATSRSRRRPTCFASGQVQA